jgi:hypothetical protein
LHLLLATAGTRWTNYKHMLRRGRRYRAWPMSYVRRKLCLPGRILIERDSLVITVGRLQELSGLRSEVASAL